MDVLIMTVLAFFAGGLIKDTLGLSFIAYMVLWVCWIEGIVTFGVTP